MNYLDVFTRNLGGVKGSSMSMRYWWRKVFPLLIDRRQENIILSDRIGRIIETGRNFMTMETSYIYAELSFVNLPFSWPLPGHDLLDKA